MKRPLRSAGSFHQDLAGGPLDETTGCMGLDIYPHTIFRSSGDKASCAIFGGCYKSSAVSFPYRTGRAMMRLTNPSSRTFAVMGDIPMS